MGNITNFLELKNLLDLYTLCFISGNITGLLAIFTYTVSYQEPIVAYWLDKHTLCFISGGNTGYLAIYASIFLFQEAILASFWKQ